MYVHCWWNNDPGQSLKSSEINLCATFTATQRNPVNNPLPVEQGISLPGQSPVFKPHLTPLKLRGMGSEHGQLVAMNQIEDTVMFSD